MVKPTPVSFAVPAPIAAQAAKVPAEEAQEIESATSSATQAETAPIVPILFKASYLINSVLSLTTVIQSGDIAVVKPSSTDILCTTSLTSV